MKFRDRAKVRECPWRNASIDWRSSSKRSLVVSGLRNDKPFGAYRRVGVWGYRRVVLSTEGAFGHEPGLKRSAGPGTRKKSGQALKGASESIRARELNPKRTVRRKKFHNGAGIDGIHPEKKHSDGAPPGFGCSEPILPPATDPPKNTRNRAAKQTFQRPWL